MLSVRKQTLRLIVEDFAAVAWPDEALDELVAPTFGLITGFQKFVNEIAELVALDLDDIGIADLRPRAARR